MLNAGTWSRFRPEHWDSEAFADQLQTNLMGTVHALEAVVPTMLAEGRGRIVGTASVAGYRGIPGAEAYGATKAALLNLFESLRGSLGRAASSSRRWSPGFVKTPMTDRNTFPMPFMVPPEEAARAIVDGMAKDKAEIVFPFPMMAAHEGRAAAAGPGVDGRLTAAMNRGEALDRRQLIRGAGSSASRAHSSSSCFTPSPYRYERRSRPSKVNPAFSATRPDATFSTAWHSSIRSTGSVANAQRQAASTACEATPRPGQPAPSSSRSLRRSRPVDGVHGDRPAAGRAPRRPRPPRTRGRRPHSCRRSSQ